jgi:hypothetical protein
MDSCYNRHIETPTQEIGCVVSKVQQLEFTSIPGTLKTHVSAMMRVVGKKTDTWIRAIPATILGYIFTSYTS